jgi:hypothetical protein
MDGNGRPDPATTASIKRTVQTKDGKATNEVMYGQSDATHIEVRLSAESQGVTTLSPEYVVLPIVLN